MAKKQTITTLPGGNRQDPEDESIHLGATGQDGLLTQHEKTPAEKRDMLDDDRKAYDYRSPSDENDLEEDHRFEDEE